MVTFTTHKHSYNIYLYIRVNTTNTHLYLTCILLTNWKYTLYNTTIQLLHNTYFILSIYKTIPIRRPRVGVGSEFPGLNITIIIISHSTSIVHFCNESKLTKVNLDRVKYCKLIVLWHRQDTLTVLYLSNKNSLIFSLFSFIQYHILLSLILVLYNKIYVRKIMTFTTQKYFYRKILYINHYYYKLIFYLYRTYILLIIWKYASYKTTKQHLYNTYYIIFSYQMISSRRLRVRIFSKIRVLNITKINIHIHKITNSCNSSEVTQFVPYKQNSITL